MFINFLDLLRTHMDTSYWTPFGCLNALTMADFRNPRWGQHVYRLALPEKCGNWKTLTVTDYIKEPWAKTAQKGKPMTIVHVGPSGCRDFTCALRVRDLGGASRQTRAVEAMVLACFGHQKSYAEVS